MITLNCIVCLKKAEVWTGHVLRGSSKEKITAGWCKEHLHMSEDVSQMQRSSGCFGQWQPEFELRPPLEMGMELPRRNSLDKNVPAEKAIYDAMQEIEKLDADVRLTEAITLLSKAKDLVSDYVDANLYLTL